MSIKITRIEGTKLKAEVSGFEIISGQVDENTKPEGPSPGKLMVASLGLCAGLYAATFLKRHNIPDKGLTVEVASTDARNPSRASAFEVKVSVKAELSEQQRDTMMAYIRACWVGNTLKGNPEITYTLNIE